MRDIPLLTTELTLQIERSFAPAETTTPAPDGSQVVRFGRTVASKQFGHWPPSRVFCFNGDDVDRLGDILAFFESARPPFFLSHSGYTRDVARSLMAVGYRPDDWKQAVHYGLPSNEPVPLPNGISIEEVDAKTIATFADVTAEGNSWDPGWTESAKAGVRESLRRAETTKFLARVNGTPAGVGELTAIGDTANWGYLGSAAVVPRFRRLGIQTALLRHRFRVAFNRAYELVTSGADFGSTSFRNQQRVGLRLAYVEATWRHDRNAPGDPA